MREAQAKQRRLQRPGKANSKGKGFSSGPSGVTERPERTRASAETGRLRKAPRGRALRFREGSAPAILRREGPGTAELWENLQTVQRNNDQQLVGDANNALILRFKMVHKDG